MIVKAKESDAGPSFSRTRLVVGSNPDSLFTKLARVVADDECEEIEYQGKVVREIAIAEQSSEKKEQKAEQWGIRLSQESCHDLVKMVIASNVTQLEVVYTYLLFQVAVASKQHSRSSEVVKRPGFLLCRSGWGSLNKCGLRGGALSDQQTECSQNKKMCMDIIQNLISDMFKGEIELTIVDPYEFEEDQNQIIDIFKPSRNGRK